MSLEKFLDQLFFPKRKLLGNRKGKSFTLRGKIIKKILKFEFWIKYRKYAKYPPTFWELITGKAWVVKPSKIKRRG